MAQNAVETTLCRIDEDGNEIEGNSDTSDSEDSRINIGNNIDSEDNRRRTEADAAGNGTLSDLDSDSDGWEDYDVIDNPTNVTKTKTYLRETLPPTVPGNRKYAGARNIPPTDDPSYGYFLDLLFTDEILDRFVEQTNSYVVHENVAKWSTLDKPELKKFFGLLLYMGIDQRPCLKMYWMVDKRFGNNFVPSIMSRDRFLDILYNLHWLDASQMSDAERKRRNREDGYWTVEEFLDLLCQNFMRYYECGRFLSIDEMAIFFKGRHRCKCYNPNKPNKWHLKAFCLNDSKTGYLHSFFMYRGKDEQRPAGIPATQWPVRKLLSNPD